MNSLAVDVAVELIKSSFHFIKEEREVREKVSRFYFCSINEIRSNLRLGKENCG